MGYWDVGTTRRMVIGRYWWPKVGQDVFRCVRTCDYCQRMKKMSACHTNMTRPITILFEVFSIDFAEPFPETKMDHEHLLVCVEHLMVWPIVVMEL